MAADNELSLSEMRMLTSSVVHMDVRQVALCVITIPKLKSAIMELLQTAPPLLPIQSQNTAKHDSSTANGQIAGTSCTDSDIDTSLLSEPPPLLHKPTTNQHSESVDPKLSPPVCIPLDAVLAESARGSTVFSMVGDKIAVGKPGKSKTTSAKRVRYITCRVCHLLFYKRDQYRDHMKLHANDPSISLYSCEQCSFVTKRRGVFNTHVLRHTGDLPFKCKLCSYAGRQVSLLRQHMHNKHPDYLSETEAIHETQSISPAIKVENTAGKESDVSFLSRSISGYT